MRWVVVVGLSGGVAGCVRLNPGFGKGADDTEGAADASTNAVSTGVAETTASDGTGSLSSGAESSSTSTASPDTDSGPTDPPPAGYPCGVDQFDILVSPAPQACGDTGGGNPLPVTINADCMSVHAEGPALVGTRATGCDSNSCTSTGDGEMLLSTQYIHLGNALEIGNSSVCRYIWAHGFPINGDPEGDCSWDALAIWTTDGQLDLAVGNGLPDDGFPNLLGRPGGPDIAVGSAVLDEATTCGVSQGACPRAGWRSFRFADMDQPALPDGLPTSASLEGQALSVVNNGLQFDLSCNRFGRWGVVPVGREQILTPQ